MPQPKGQSASRPERLFTQFSPGCSSRPRASRSSSLGRGVGLVFLWGALSFSLSSVVFPCWFLGRNLEAWRCAVATSAVPEVRRGGCVASPCNGKVLPDSTRLLHQEHRAPTREPCNSSGIPRQYFCTQLGIEVLTQTFLSRFLWPRSDSYRSAVR